MGDDGSTVSYTVKELIERLERKLDTYLTLLAGKADRSDLQALDDRLGTVEQHVVDRLGSVEQHVAALRQREEAEEKRVEWKRWLIPTLATLVLAGATVVSLVHH